MYYMHTDLQDISCSFFTFLLLFLLPVYCLIYFTKDFVLCLTIRYPAFIIPVILKFSTFHIPFVTLALPFHSKLCDYSPFWPRSGRLWSALAGPLNLNVAQQATTTTTTTATQQQQVQQQWQQQQRKSREECVCRRKRRKKANRGLRHQLQQFMCLFNANVAECPQCPPRSHSSALSSCLPPLPVASPVTSATDTATAACHALRQRSVIAL